MQIITGELEGHTSEYPLSRFGGRENILAVDIETTGLTAEKDQIYLIGCGYWEEDCWKLIQWFDDTGDGEADILTSFLLFTKKFTTLLHYNGRQFDLPFLARRIVWNGLQAVPGAENFPSEMKSLDLYRYVKPFQKLLSLPDCRQQTIEQFLGTGRTECRNGKELIQVYQDYIHHISGSGAASASDDLTTDGDSCLGQASSAAGSDASRSDESNAAGTSSMASDSAAFGSDGSGNTESAPNQKVDLTAAATKRIDAAMINQLLRQQALLNKQRAAAQYAAEHPEEAATDASGSESSDSDAFHPDEAKASESGLDGNVLSGSESFDGAAELHFTSRSAMRLALLSHNGADVAGLIAMTDVLGWKDLLTAEITIHRAQANTYRDENGEPQQELILHGTLSGVSADTFKAPITTSKDACYCTITGNKITLKIPIYNGKLHYYYANYKDYYYLPELDQAVHKSIATYVDKEHRQQATAATCYTGKVGAFLPEWTQFRSPFFQKNVKDKVAWFEFKPEMKKDKSFFAEYATYVYRHVIEIGTK